MVTRLSAQPRWLIGTLSLRAAPAGAAAPGDPPTVLVLFSDEGRTPATSLLFTGMQRELRDRPDLTLLSQFLDIASFGRERHATEMAEFYRLRYADRHVDIVVTIGVPATAFVGQHGRRIWPSARIVAVAPSAHQISAAAYAAANDRVEVRFPDSSCNGYMAFASMLMAGLDGVQNKIVPPDPIDKDLYDLEPE